jgi:alpha-tubulin suppressor-like RCC1 family protein
VSNGRSTFTTSGFSGCAILIGNDIKCWGSNSYGELGLGDTTMRGLHDTEMGDNLPALAYP